MRLLGERGAKLAGAMAPGAGLVVMTGGPGDQCPAS